MRHILLSLTLLSLTATAAVPTVQWQTLGNAKTADQPTYVQRFTIDGAEGVARICFNQFARKMRVTDPRDTIAEIVPGYYYLASPKFAGGSAVIDVVTSGTLRHHSYMPDGAHAVLTDGSVVPVKFTRHKISDRRAQWSLPGSDLMPDAAEIYARNAVLASGAAPGPFDLIPSLKSVKVAKGKHRTKFDPRLTRIAEHPIAHDNPEFYRIEVTPDSFIIEYASQQARILANTTLSQLIVNNPDGIPLAVIEDYPDFPYRAVMIDIARNFLALADLQKVAQYLARYRFNTLHFHFADDEAWRLEIPSLPELTNVGSRRGYTLDEKDFLAQIFAGNGNPDSPDGTANGYISRREFIDFLRYCRSLGIDVIPEVESPGHARAAIKAMENRYRRTGDDSLRLVEDGDNSVYTSAQSFHDNIMNPGLEGPYRFMEIVCDEIKSMYDEAGVELKAIHIGGDEVPSQGWDGAPAVQRLKREQGLATQDQVHAYFVERIAQMLARKNIPMSGWMEVAVGHTPEYDKTIAPLCSGINFWKTTKTSKAPQAAEAGYPVIICNVDHYYLDQCYNNHPEEHGLTWGGLVDEFAALNGYPWEMCPVDSAYRGNVKGVSAQIFSETIRNFSDVQSMLFPKALGVAERGWNASPTYSDADFNQMIFAREYPALAVRGVDYHLRQPGIKVADGRLMMNSPYSSAVIRYTTDGTNPTAQSPIYLAPIELSDLPEDVEVRATLFHLGHQSLPTILFVKFH